MLMRLAVHQVLFPHKRGSRLSTNFLYLDEESPTLRLWLQNLRQLINRYPLDAGAQLIKEVAYAPYTSNDQARCAADDRHRRDRDVPIRTGPGQKAQHCQIMLMMDDVGWSDFGAYAGGGKALGHPTPNIDRIANEGVPYSPAGTASRAVRRVVLRSSTGRIPIRTALSVVVAPGWGLLNGNEEANSDWSR